MQGVNHSKLEVNSKDQFVVMSKTKDNVVKQLQVKVLQRLQHSVILQVLPITRRKKKNLVEFCLYGYLMRKVI